MLYNNNTIAHNHHTHNSISFTSTMIQHRYCRVSHCHKDLDLELSCLSVSGVKKDWSSGEATYDALKEGIILRVPIA